MIPRSRILPRAMLGDRMLPLVIATNVFLACLAILGAVAATGVASRWSSDIEQLVTVQVAPRLGETSDDKVQAVLVALRDDPAAASAHALEMAEIQSLLAPWLGEGNALGELPIPRLIDIELRPGADADMLRARLEAKFPGITVDDHRAWHGKAQQVRRNVSIGAAAIIGLIMFAGVAVIAFATRASLREHRQLVALLHIIGATDAYTAREFQRHFLGLGVIGAVLGAVPVAGCLALAHLLGTGGASLWLAGAALSPGDYIVLALPPFGAAALTMLTARVTVLRALKRMN